MADHTDGMDLHLSHHDWRLARAACGDRALSQSHGWKFRWVSNGSSFNNDFRVSFTPKQVATGHADYIFGGSTKPMRNFLV
jgi:predicted dithiol-disulfide oxidoreductase (DUF899 family)